MTLVNVRLRKYTDISFYSKGVITKIGVEFRNFDALILKKIISFLVEALKMLFIVNVSILCKI